MQNNITIRQKFVSYLLQIYMTEQRSSEIVAFAESSLSDFIRRYFYSDYESIYENTDYNFYRRIRESVPTYDAALKENQRMNDLYTMVMKYYIDFLQSKTFRGKEKVYLTAKEKNVKKRREQEKKKDPLQPSTNVNDELVEGAIRQVNITRHERNKTLRQICLNHYGYICQVCGMNFEERYGEIGKDFIEVHHLQPIADTDCEHALDPKEGLVPLCSNCHSMIHKGGKNGKPMTLEELKAVFNLHKK